MKREMEDRIEKALEGTIREKGIGIQVKEGFIAFQVEKNFTAQDLADIATVMGVSLGNLRVKVTSGSYEGHYQIHNYATVMVTVMGVDLNNFRTRPFLPGLTG